MTERSAFLPLPAALADRSVAVIASNGSPRWTPQTLPWRPTTNADEQMHNGLRVQNSVVTQDVAVLQSLALTGEALLTSAHTFLVLDHLLDVVHALRRLHMESERGSAKGLDENLKACRGRVIDM